MANPEIDYRKILVRYIATVISCEGVSFIGDQGLGDDLTDDENRALKLAESEADAILA